MTAKETEKTMSDGNKIISFIVPAYNSQEFLVKCLLSFISGSRADEKIEVIIVNDGSKDDTKSVALGFTRSRPEIFRLIDKKNGGHGSAINAALPEAHGKYIKVIDSDDWIVTENLEKYIEALETSDADILITHFHTVNARTGKITPIKSSSVTYGKKYSLEGLMAAGKGALSCCMFHGITYEADFYRGCGVTLSERISYEDQEYCTLPFIKAESIIFADLFLYEYLVGSANQSVADENQVLRAGQLEQVFWKILRGAAPEKISEAAKAYLLYKLAETLQNYYVTMLIRNSDRKNGRREAARIRRLSAKELPPLKELTSFRYGLLLLMHFLHIKPSHLETLKNSPLYLWMRRAIR